MDQTPPDPVQPGAHSRRHVLGLALVAGAGLPVLAACGGDDGTATRGDSSGSAASDSPSAAASSAAAGRALVATSKVPVNGGVVLDGPKVVVTQPTEGTFKAFTAVCTHQACTVGSVKNGVITCPCHGSAYSATDGSVENGPATRALAEIPVTVEDGEVVKA
jgi:Rieske Fe-S protein